ncbi:MAG: flippase-like domain-containing protein [Bacteroidetes bacterium]|nr:flippase-like domain-containing protein [Bacteroidota bacterium]
MSKRLITTGLQYLAFLGIGLLFAWLSLRELDREKWQQLSSSVQNAKLWLVIPVSFLLLLSHYLRGIRWKLLIDPLGYKIKPINSFLTVLIGYLVNLGVPRLGEFIRCTFLSRYEKVEVEKLVGTVIVERLFDAVCLLIVFGLTWGLQPDLYERFSSVLTSNSQTATAGNPYFNWLILAFLLLFTGWIIWKKKKLTDLVDQVLIVFNRVLNGLLSVRKLKKPRSFLLLTLAIWVLYLLSGYIGFMAFDATRVYGITEALTILSVGSIGMIISPGGIGIYAYLILQTMQAYGLDYTNALAFGWILWLVQTAVILCGGVLSFGVLPWINADKEKNNQ